MTKPNITLRRLEIEDLTDADKLRQEAGWNQTLVDWRRLLNLDTEGCFAAMDQNRLVGTATTTSFGLDVAWIGMVLVDSTYRNQGIGRQLLARCIEHLKEKGVRCIKLDATPAGQLLYEKLGFQVEWPLDRWMKMENKEPEKPLPPRDVVPVQPTDWNELLSFDQEVFGVDRSSLLRQLGEDSTQVVICKEKDGGVNGFGFLRAGVRADFIGPVAAKTEEMGKTIIHNLLHATQRSVFWDIPEPCAPSSALAKELGFVCQRPLTRMYLGKNNVAGSPEKLWAISDPATG